MKLTNRECSALARKIIKEISESRGNNRLSNEQLLNVLNDFKSSNESDIEILTKYGTNVSTSYVLKLFQEAFPDYNFTCRMGNYLSGYSFRIGEALYCIGHSLKNEKVIPKESDIVDDIVIYQIDNNDIESIIQVIKAKYE